MSGTTIPLSSTANSVNRAGLWALPVWVGLLDVSVILSYVFSTNLTVWYGGVLAAKFVLVLMNSRRIAFNRNQAIFILAVILGVIPGTLLNSYAGDGLARVLGFCFQIYLTTCLLGRQHLQPYLRAIAMALAVASAIHGAMCVFGFMPDHYGRYLYFGGNHPNLGAEIGVIGVLAAALTLRLRFFMLTMVPIAWSILLMQGRAAMLSIVLLVAARIGFRLMEIARTSPVKALSILSVLLVCVGGLLITIPQLLDTATGIFMLNDQYRGLGSGLVGRDIRWNTAISLMESNPLFGVGINYFQHNVLFTPHNYFLYGLSTMGIVGFLIFLVALSGLYVRTAKIDGQSALLLAGMVPLLIYNDRLLNLNPYPFVLYIVLIAFPLHGLSHTFRQQGMPSRLGQRNGFWGKLGA